MTGETRAFLQIVVGSRLAPSRRMAALVAELKPRHLTRAAAEVERRLGDTKGQMPPTARLQDIADRVRSVWRRTQSLAEVSRQDLRHIAWVAFYPPGAPEEWLGGQVAFWRRLEERLESTSASSAIGSLAPSFLMTYPYDLATFQAAAATIGQLLGGSTRPRLHRWKERVRGFGLLDKNAHASLAKRLLTDGASVPDLLEQCGLAGLLGRSRFLECVQQQLEGRMTAQLAAGASSTTAIARFAAVAELEGRLRFEHRRRDIATALLQPFLSRNPTADVQQAIQAFLLRHLGDVRVTVQGWLGVPQEIRAGMLRWMVRGTLDTFFEIVRLTAEDRMWNARKQFWSRYLERGLVTDAWIALGPDAAQYAARLPRESAGGAARLLRGTGVLAGHSILLMRLGNLTVVDWSHNGKCRIWRAANRAAPQVYLREYQRQHVTVGADLEVVHRSGWQEEISEWLRHETGVRVW